MDDKQLNESLSLFYTDVPSKKGEEYRKWSLISFFFLTNLRNCFVNSFTDILPIGNDFKSSSQNGRRFHLHLRFVPIRDIVPVRRKSMFTYVCLILSFHFIKELKMNFLFC